MTGSTATSEIVLSTVGTARVYGGKNNSGNVPYIAVGDKENISSGAQNSIRISADHVFIPSAFQRTTNQKPNVYISSNGELFTTN